MKQRNLNGPQQITRIPPYRPGQWVKVKDLGEGGLGSDLSGVIRRVKSITCSINSPDQKRAVWRVHFDDGRCLEWHLIERHATAAEIRRLSSDAAAPDGRQVKPGAVEVVERWEGDERA